MENNFTTPNNFNLANQGTPKDSTPSNGFSFHAPQEGTSEYVQLHQDIFNNIKGEANILKISDLLIGQKFEGYCWATRINCIEDLRVPDKYKIVLTLIDGDGIQFRATYYNADKFIPNKETPVFIKGVNYIPQEGKDIFYMLSEFAISKVPLERSMFIKEIDGIKELVTEFESVCSNIKDAGLNTLVQNFLQNKGYMYELKSTTYKPDLGTRLGYKLFISLSLIKAAEPYKSMKIFDYETYVTGCLLMHYNEDIIVGSETRPNLLPVDSTLFQEIMQSTLNISQKEILLNMLTIGDCSITSPERQVFKSSIFALEKVLKMNEIFIRTGTSWQKNAVIYR